jgi:hypothetical protein
VRQGNHREDRQARQAGGMRRRKGFDQMSDEQVETMVREIIEQHLADAPRRAALLLMPPIFDNAILV